MVELHEKDCEEGVKLSAPFQDSFPVCSDG